MLASQRDGVALELLDAEKLRAQQFGIAVVTQRMPCVCRKTEPFDGDDILLA